MAAYNWIYGLVGLWLVWVIMSILATLTGFFFGLYDMLKESFAKAGIVIPASWDAVIANIDSNLQSTWNWIGIVIFGSFIVYIIVSSMRKRPEEVFY